MKNLFTEEFEKYAVNHPALGMPSEEKNGGCYVVELKNSKGKKINLFIMAAFGEGWDHVSVSLKHRCPNWHEMEYIKRMFFKEDEVAFQLHVPAKDHINIHENVLHMWRPQDQEIPMPKEWMV